MRTVISNNIQWTPKVLVLQYVLTKKKVPTDLILVHKVPIWLRETI